MSALSDLQLVIYTVAGPFVLLASATILAVLLLISVIAVGLQFFNEGR